MEEVTQKFINSILKATGEYYKATMSERIKAGMKKAKLEGKNVFATKKKS